MNRDITKDELQKMYLSGSSLRNISLKLDCSIHKVTYWMNKYGIPRRSRSEAVYLMHNPNGDPFRIKQKLSNQDVLLLGIGIGIYLGEGNKIIRHSIRIANTDPQILTLFLRFLSEICGFRNDRISCSIVCFKDTNPELARAYWSNELQISPDRFGKITRIPSQGKGTYRKKSKFGVCTVQANNIRLTTWLRDQIQQLGKELPG